MLRKLQRRTTVANREISLIKRTCFAGLQLSLQTTFIHIVDQIEGAGAELNTKGLVIPISVIAAIIVKTTSTS